MPTSARASFSNRPAGPTKGRPSRSSWSPGCSPTKAMSAPSGPSPSTGRLAPGVGGSEAVERLQGLRLLVRREELALTGHLGLIPRAAFEVIKPQEAVLVPLSG